MDPERLLARLRVGTVPVDASRRRFVATTVGGLAGLALMPARARAQGAAESSPGSRPTERPAAFVSIARDGTATVLCNRLDMGQGIETALAMLCAEELDLPWRQVRTGFGDHGPAYADPQWGVNTTGGSVSIRHSARQYQELGARARAMLVAAAARRWNVPPAALVAADGRVRGAGRSAGYGELFEAAMREPIPEAVVLKDPSTYRIVGKPTPLTVSRLKASGDQVYGLDLRLPGLLTAVIARPPAFGARAESWDGAKALAVPGVRAVLPVELDRGGRGVAVVGEGYWRAKLGRDALSVAWDTASVERADTEALLAQYRELAARPGTLAPEPRLQADLAPLASASRRIEAEYVFPYLSHAAMEPLSCVVDLREDGCTVMTASQAPGTDAAQVARVTGLRPEQVRIVVQMAGGSFGRRASPASDFVVESVQVARALVAAGRRAPVKVVWSREDDMRAGYYRPMAVHRAEIGLDETGRVVAWDHRIVAQRIVAGPSQESDLARDGVDASAFDGMREPYALPMRLTVHHPKVNVPVLWWRAVGSTHTAFVMETLIDEIAAAAQRDPVEYRLALTADNPRATRYRAALRLAVERSGYGRRTLPAGTAWGVAVHESFDSVVAYVVEARLAGQGASARPMLARVTAGVHCNAVVNPSGVEAQVQGSVLMALATTLPGHEITLKDGEVVQGNFDRFVLPRITDMPQVSVHVVPSTDPPTGMGEPALPPLAPAYANALSRLTGRRIRALPFPSA